MKICFALFILFLFCTYLFPQETTGNLEGWILNEDKIPVADVNISVNSISLQGMRGAATNNNGHFRIVALPVGDYNVEISHVI